MCERNDTPGDDLTGNMVFHRFKKQLAESGFKSICKKCTINPGYVLLQKKDVFCAACLNEYCVHKFRSTIGKSRLVKPGEKVLVSCSGGLNSLVLVDLIRQGLAEDIHRRIRFLPSLLFIDESIFSSNTDEGFKSVNLRKDLFEFMLDSKLSCYFTSLELCLSPEDDSSFILEVQTGGELQAKYERVQQFLQEKRTKYLDIFLNCFNRLESLTSKHDFLTRLRYLIMVRVAKLAQFRRIMVASTASELAVTLMSNISLGRGIELQSEMNFCDDRFDCVTILRPIREFSSKEIAFYARHRNLCHLAHKTDITTTGTPIKSSIGRLTEGFLMELQEEFPATIYTVFKTGNKITSSDSNENNRTASRCKFCWAKIDTNFQRDRDEYSAFEALQLTSALSNSQPESTAINQPDNEGGNKFCYSCIRFNNEMNQNTNENNTNLFERFCIL